MSFICLSLSKVLFHLVLLLSYFLLLIWSWTQTLFLCIFYYLLQAQFKEAPVYLIRFKQCLNQAIGMLKQLVVRILKSATEQTSSHINKVNFLC